MSQAPSGSFAIAQMFNVNTGGDTPKIAQTVSMTGWREPKEPAAIPRSMRLRERANSLKAQADELLRKADALLTEAERLDCECTSKETCTATDRDKDHYFPLGGNPTALRPNPKNYSFLAPGDSAFASSASRLLACTDVATRTTNTPGKIRKRGSKISRTSTL